MKSYKNGVFDIALLCSKLSFDTCWKVLTLVGVSFDVYMKYKRCEDIKRCEEQEMKKAKIGF